MIGRLIELELEGFRLFRDRFVVPLDGNIVLIYGRNGTGKSSFLSALEYAVTGTVSDYARFEGDYPRCLSHIHAQQPPKVVLRYRTPDGDVSATGIDPSTAGLATQRGLQRVERRHFVERCYLSQSRLARLLEAYQAPDVEHADPPLVRFVRELLGLDLLENLASGLHLAGHVRRIEKSVPGLERLRSEANRLEVELQKATERRAVARTIWMSLRESLLKQFGVAVGETAASVREMREEVERSSSQSRPAGAISQRHNERLRLQNALEILRSTEEVIDRPAADAEARIEELHADLAALERQLRPTIELIENALTDLGTIAADALGSGDLGLRFAAIERSTEKAREWFTEEFSALGQSEDELRSLQVRQSELENLLARSTEVGSETLQAQVDRITILNATLHHLHGDDCPVCGRDYSELRKGTLQDRVSEQLRRLESDLASAAEEARRREELTRELTIIERRIGPLIELRSREALRRSRTEVALARLESVARDAAAARPLRDLWMQLQVKLMEATARLAATAVRERQREDAMSIVHRIATDLGVSSERTPPPVKYAEAAARELDQRIERGERAYLTATRILDRLKTAESAAADYEDAEGELRKVLKRREQISAALSRVDNEVRRARRLRNAAADAQSKLLNQLFSDTLNELWSDLFQRLVPSERFEPRLVAETGSRGKILAGMEGVADSQTFKHLGSVLSMGNLNTAALTLFLSLNLIEQPRNRVLILDDPVQNMDDVHVVNLSGVLRSIAYQTGRQVLVAVHERALFEYLQTDLAPASESERMITIELTKDQSDSSGIDHRIVTWNPRGELLAG